MRSITSQEKELKLQDLLDISSLRSLMDSFVQFTGLNLAIVDLDGEFLVASGWRRICLDFHRKNSETAARCHISDTVLAGQLSEGHTYNVYECENGLVDVAVPIIIEGVYLGNLFTGQFLFEEPDFDFFSRQAEEFGFDKKEYLNALAKVPVYSSDKIKDAIRFMTDLTNIIVSVGIEKIKLIELNCTLEKRVKDRTKDLEKSIQIRRNAEQELQKNKKFLESVFNSIQDGISVLDKDLNVLDTNQIMKEWYPSLEELRGQKCHKIYFDRSHPCTTCPSVRALKSGHMEMEEVPLWSKDGDIGTLELFAFPFRDNDGEITGVVEYVRNITARKRAEKQMQLEKLFSESLVNSLPGIMYLFDKLGRMKRWNKNFETVTGYTAEQIENMNPLEFIDSADRLRVQETIQQVFSEGQSSIEGHIITLRGKKVPYLLTGYLMDHEDIQYLVGIGQDISDRVQAAREQEHLIKKLQETLSQVKQLSGFLPICASCKKIRDDEGYWNQIEAYLKKHSEVVFSHGLCPDCAQNLYPELDLKF